MWVRLAITRTNFTQWERFKSRAKSKQRKWLQTGCDLRLSDTEALPSWWGHFLVLDWTQLCYTMLLSLIRRPRFQSFYQRLGLENRTVDAVGAGPNIHTIQPILWVCTPMMPCSPPLLESTASSHTECSRRLTWMVFTGVSYEDLIVEPQMGHGHPVLGQSPSLVWANDRGGAEGLHCFQVLHQAVLLGHPFSCQWQSHLDRREREKQRGREREEEVLRKIIISNSSWFQDGGIVIDVAKLTK